MRDNPIRDFREKRLGWSRAQLGERLHRSDKLVAVYEAEAGDDLLRELARLASETATLIMKSFSLRWPAMTLR